MAQLKDTTVSGNLTASKIIKSGGGSELLVADGTTIAQSSIAAGSATNDENGNNIANTYATKSSLGNAASKNVGTTSGTVAAGDHTHAHDDLTGLFPWMRKSITLDSIVLDGTTLKNVEFENVGNGIFLSKNILKGISMYRLLVDDGGTYVRADADVGTGTIGRNAAASIEAALKRQFGDSVSLKTYVRTYDGAIHSEKVFLPLECEVHGLTKYSKYADTLGKYQQWSIPNNKIKTGNNGWWWCANKAPDSGDFCAVGKLGDPDVHFLNAYDVDSGVALAFYL